MTEIALELSSVKLRRGRTKIRIRPTPELTKNVSRRLLAVQDVLHPLDGEGDAMVVDLRVVAVLADRRDLHAGPVLRRDELGSVCQILCRRSEVTRSRLYRNFFL